MRYKGAETQDIKKNITMFLCLFILLMVHKHLNGQDFLQKKQFSQTIEKQFEVNKETSLHFEIIGNIEVRVWDKDSANIFVDYERNEKFFIVWNVRKDSLKIDIQKRENEVTIKSSGEGVSLISLPGLSKEKINYILSVPDYVTLDIWNNDGEVIVRDMKNKVIIESEGDIKLSDINSSSIKVRTSGRIDAERVTGNIHFRSEKGGIRLRDINSTNLVAESDEEVVQIEMEVIQEGTCRVETNEGDIHLYVPNGTSATIEAFSMSGKVDINLPNSSDMTKDRKVEKQIVGDGKAHVYLRTKMGNIRVRTR